MDGGDDWDLAAVVRGCRSRVKPSAAAVDPLLPSVVAVAREEEHISSQQQQQQQKQQRAEDSAAGVAKKPQRPAPTQPPRSKRRKKQLKKVVCQVPADGASSDMWAWRKYGQKPIKGSPYPRSYYRCSSFRGCPARKQVERNRTDPGQLIIAYTAEHNHPVPPRRKFLSTPPATTTSVSDSALAAVQENGNKDRTDRLASSPAMPASEEGEFVVEDIEMIGEDELVFVGGTLETGEGASSSFADDDGGGFDDRIFASPWLQSGNNSSATAAAC